MMEVAFGIILLLALFIGLPLLIKRAVDRRPFDPDKHVVHEPTRLSAGSISADGEVTVRGIGYRDVVTKIARTCAEQARQGRVLRHSRRGAFSQGGMGSPMGWKLYFEEVGEPLDAPIGTIEVEVVRFGRGAKVAERQSQIEAVGGVCWYSLSVTDRGYPYVVIGYEIPHGTSTPISG